MGDMVDRDQEHLRLLKWGYYVMAGMAAFFTLICLMWAGMAGIFASGAIPAQASSSGDPRIAGLIFLIFGIAVFVFGLSFALLTYYTGRSLAERRRRILCLVVAALCCLQIPWGTLIGICTFIVLNRPSVRALFEPGTNPGLAPQAPGLGQ